MCNILLNYATFSKQMFEIENFKLEKMSNNFYQSNFQKTKKLIPILVGFLLLHLPNFWILKEAVALRHNKKY